LRGKFVSVNSVFTYRTKEKSRNFSVPASQKLILFYAFASAGFGGRGTGVCFSTWLAVAHSASLAGLFL
jgi:hypothetical protein